MTTLLRGPQVFSDNRTVYYPEDFDSLSSEDETVPAPTKRGRKPQAKHVANGRTKKKTGKPKVINTEAKAVVPQTKPTVSLRFHKINLFSDFSALFLVSGCFAAH